MKSIKNVYNKANQVRTDLLLFTDKEIQKMIKQNENHKYIKNNTKKITTDYSYLTFFEEKFTYSQETKYYFLSSERKTNKISPVKITNYIKTSRYSKDKSKYSTDNSSKIRKRFNTIIYNKQKEQIPLPTRNNSCSIKEKSNKKSCFNIPTDSNNFPSSRNNKKNGLKKKKLITKNLNIKSRINARRFLKNLCFSLKRTRGRLESFNFSEKLKNKNENKNYKKFNNEDNNNNLILLKNNNFMSSKRLKVKRPSVINCKNIELLSNINIINNITGKKRKSLFFRKGDE